MSKLPSGQHQGTLSFNSPYGTSSHADLPFSPEITRTTVHDQKNMPGLQAQTCHFTPLRPVMDHLSEVPSSL